MNTQIATAPKVESVNAIGPWGILDLIAEGAATEVYRVKHVDSGQDGVLKLFKSYVDGDLLAAKEAQAFQLMHPNLPTFLDRGVRRDGGHFVVSEFIDGPNLEEVLLRIGKLPVEDAVLIAQRLASALDAAHSAGLLHRDLKPSNVIIPNDKGLDGVTLLDFSVAGTLESESQQTRAGQFFGTPNYMSPEQLKRACQTRATDIWGLGALLYQMLTGKRPFERETVAQTVYAIAGDKLELSVDDPWQLNDLLSRCLAKNPEDRFQTAQALGEDLASWRKQKTAFVGAFSSEIVGPSSPASTPSFPAAMPEAMAPQSTSENEIQPVTATTLPKKRNVARVIGLIMASLMLAGLVGAGAVWVIEPRPNKSMTTPSVEPEAPASTNPASKPVKPSSTSRKQLPFWAYFLPLLVAGILWVVVRKGLGADEKKSGASGLGLGELDPAMRREILVQNLGVAADDMIALCQSDAPANFMALSLGLAVQDYRDEREPENKSAALEQAVKLLELLQQRVPNTLDPWYVRYNQLLALVLSLAGLILTLLGMLLPKA